MEVKSSRPSPRTIVTVFLLLSAVSVTVHPQSPESESQRLTSQMFALYKNGDFEGALTAGERVLELQTKGARTEPSGISTAAMNLARIKKLYLDFLREKKEESNVSTKRRFEVYSDFPNQIEELSRRAIAATAQQSPKDSKQLASLQIELATFIVERDEHATTRGNNYEKARKLFEDSLPNLADGGKGSEAYLSGLLASADFFQRYAEFERSLPLYLEFVSLASVKLGPASQVLSRPLVEIAQIHIVIDEAAAAHSYFEKAVAIPDSKVSRDLPPFDLTRRSNSNLEEDLMQNPGTITTYMKKLKSVFVDVEIDESGKVTAAKSQPNSEIDIFGKSVAEKSEKLALSTKFRPLKIGGTPKRMKGRVLIPYFVRA